MPLCPIDSEGENVGNLSPCCLAEVYFILASKATESLGVHAIFSVHKNQSGSFHEFLTIFTRFVGTFVNIAVFSNSLGQLIFSRELETKREQCRSATSLH